MGIVIIQERKRREVAEYHLEFRWADGVDGGFAFPCDFAGRVDQEKLTEVGWRSYRDCMSDDGTIFRGPYVRKFVRRVVDPKIGRCVCGREISLEGFTNTCDCGRDYNWNGSLLADRSQWGEETGETAADILGPSRDPELAG